MLYKVWLLLLPLFLFCVVFNIWQHIKQQYAISGVAQDGLQL